MAKKIVKSAKDKKKLSKKPAAKKAVAKPVKKQAAKKPAKPVAKKAVAVKAPTKKITAKAEPKKAAKAPVPKKVVEKPMPPVKAKVSKAEVAPKIEEVEDVEVAELQEEQTDDEVVLTDAEGRRYCRVKDCDQLAAVDSYCRYHYLALWKKIQVRKKILSEGKLERYIEELTARYPDKFLEMLRKDLRSEKEFLAAIQELEIDENAVDNEFEDETQNYIDEVRGIEPAARDEEDF